MKLNIVAEWLTLLLHIWVVKRSNLGPETDYAEVYRGFPQPF
jgi:hypothetical protein